MPDAVAFRTDCRSKAEGNPIRAAKCRFEPRGTRLPDARISKPHPRKGTETLIQLRFHRRKFQFQNHIPARGRKLVREVLGPVRREHKFQNHIPVRGRKPCQEVSSGIFLVISKPHPRKGTETVSHPPTPLWPNRIFQNHIPVRGRKREIVVAYPLEELFQNHIPARGRKLSWLFPPIET